MADWKVMQDSTGRLLGWVTDMRADDGAVPSQLSPADEEAAPFEAYTSTNAFIAAMHSLPGALALLANHAAGLDERAGTAR
jgi:hypothetical protein